MAWQDNVNYKVLLQNHGTQSPGQIIAYTPENFALRLQNQWEQVFSNFLSNAVGGLGADGMSAFTSTTPFIKQFTGHVWRGTEAITFQLKILFDAINDVEADVFTPITQLITWSSPYQSTGVTLTAPGPNLVDNTERLSLRIGRFMYFDSVIVTNMDVQFETAMHSSGKPIAAEVDIEFRTFYTMTRDDILAVFGSAGDFNFSGVNGSVPASLEMFKEKLAPYFPDLGLTNMNVDEFRNSLVKGG